jgi:hypothetical protein
VILPGVADPHGLRQLAAAYPEDIFPTPPMERRAFDAAAADVLRRAAVPHYLACADRIEALEAFVQRFIDVGFEFDDPTQLIDLHDEAVALLSKSR